MTNFISQSYIKNTSVCIDIIDFFESSADITQGQCQNVHGETIVDANYKNCSQAVLDTNEALYWKYVNFLQESCNQYAIDFPYCNEYSPWRICEPISIQKYEPGQAFSQYHTERIGRNGIQSSRHLVFMTYLNDVLTGGETEFFHQKLFVKPKQGLTLIWPADWTHTHRGIPAPFETKYIVTGWYNYVD